MRGQVTTEVLWDARTALRASAAERAFVARPALSGQTLRRVLVPALACQFLAAALMLLGGYAAPLFLATCCWSVILLALGWGRYVGGGVAAHVGADGVTTKSWPRGRVRRVAWAAIGRCEVRTRRNGAGKTVTSHCLIYDRAGRQVLKLNLLDIDTEAVPELLDAVRYHGPAPTELLSASAPEGRGTELSAADEPARLRHEPPDAGQETPALEPGREAHTAARAAREPR